MATDTIVRGGGWLLEETPAGGILTRERLNDEQRLIGRTAEEFVDSEVTSKISGRPVGMRSRLVLLTPVSP